MEADGLDKTQHLREGQLLNDRADLIAALRAVCQIRITVMLSQGEAKALYEARDLLARLEKGA